MTSSTAIDLFRGEYRFLSNFCPARVTWGDEIYRTIEHAYQAAKTLDLGERRRVREAATPGDARRIGRTVTQDLNWIDYRLSVMYLLLVQKFSHPPFRQLLLDTHPRRLIEGNTWGDTFWGICNGAGLNHLGLLLMRVRNELREDA